MRCNYAAVACREGITCAWVPQVMDLLHLAPEIQEHILSMHEIVGRPTITERALRPIAQIRDAREQIQLLHALLP